MGAQLLILKAAQDIATPDKDRSYSLPEPSLEYHILREIDMVKETGRAEPSHYPSEDQKELSKRLICFDDVVCFEGPEVDMFDRLHSHLQHISEEPLGEWKSDFNKNALIAFNNANQYVARVSDILISTNNKIYNI
ncbi:hypothetical protein AARAC_010557 [Aspergillus arachidicola]|uniref:Uncharacterized protein n=1 Tax=Aspergillus arachidicola TaxID=656916 RepID=A0A2G7FLK6_9EURO|nr:hypothetical protein AARAC_010557 [Aspergillus arachidicola]